MGEQADMIIDGEVCELCACFFTETHGYPVVCKDCWKDLTKSERQAHQKAIYDIEN